MKSNEEFIEGIYSKKDALVKKRKKKISVIATAVCAAICVVASVGVVGVQQPEKVVEIYNDIRKLGSSATRSEFEDADKSENETSTAVSEDNEYLFLTENYTKPTKPAAENENSDKIKQEGFVGSPEVLTDVAEGEVGAENFAPEASESDGDSASPTKALSESNPMPSTAEIVDAAYEMLPEEDKQSVIKDKAVATVTRYADGTQIYEVTFTDTASLQTAIARHIKVQLDSDLNMIRILDI